MFELRRELNSLPLAAGSVLELHSGVNRPSIAADGHDAQEARAFYCSGHGASGIEAYIYLHLLVANIAMVYQWDEAIDKADYPDVKDAGITFAESMGFMMEDRQVRRLDAASRDVLFNESGLFRPIVIEPAPAAAPEVLPLEGDLDEEVMVLESETRSHLPPETVLELSIESPSTRPVYGQAAEQSAASGGDPLEDKNFKVFLRLLTSV